MNAALNSSMVNAARLLGPSIDGVLIAAVGEGWCFLFDALSYLAVIASLLLMRLPRRERQALAGAPILPELKAGWSYVASSAPIASLLILFALVSLVGMPYTVLMPIVASTVLHGGPRRQDRLRAHRCWPLPAGPGGRLRGRRRAPRRGRRAHGA